jgi:hypothetical protein
MKPDMTKEQIEQMPAGEEINALIETEIYKSVALTDDEMELVRAAWLIANPSLARDRYRLSKNEVSNPHPEYESKYQIRWPQNFSEDDRCAAALVQKMRREGWLFSLYEVPGSGVETLRIAAFEKLPHSNLRGYQGKAEANTDALAIARAALIAKIEEGALHKRGVL